MKTPRRIITREMKLQEKQEDKELAEAKKSLRAYLNREKMNQRILEIFGPDNQ